MPAVSYNPYDAAQSSFLAALALGETGPSGTGYSTGVGGVDLSGASTDKFGFPQWSGSGNSHAAGEFQFQPATWDSIAAAHGLSFSNPSDQNAGAWYLAQSTYAQNTGRDLSADLAAGDYSRLDTALASVWPSVRGNGASPGLAQALVAGQGASLSGGANPISADTSGGPLGLGGFLKGVTSWVTDEFTRFGILIIGALVILVALWFILSDKGVVPSPGEVAKGAALAVAA